MLALGVVLQLAVQDAAASRPSQMVALGRDRVKTLKIAVSPNSSYPVFYTPGIVGTAAYGLGAC